MEESDTANSSVLNNKTDTAATTKDQFIESGTSLKHGNQNIQDIKEKSGKDENSSVLNPKIESAATTKDQILDSVPSLKSGEQNIQDIKEKSGKDQNSSVLNPKIDTAATTKDQILESVPSLNPGEQNVQDIKEKSGKDENLPIKLISILEDMAALKSELLSDNKIKKESILEDNQNLVENSTVTLEQNLKPEQSKEVKPETKESVKRSTSVKHDGSTEGRVSFEKDHIEKHYDRVSTKRHWTLGAIGRILGLEFAPINIPLTRRMETFGVTFWMSTFLFMGFGSLGLLIYIFLYTQYWWVSMCYLTWYLGDRSICNRGGRRFEWMRRWQLWKHMANFFPVHFIKTTELDPHRNYILGYHPHGILSAGAFVNFSTEGSGFSKVFPGFTPYLLTLSGHFHLPFYREFFMSSGAVSATRESMDYLLGREGSGRLLCLVVGGAKESLDCHPGQHILHLSKRKGFCKMALRHGAPIVPMFSFGENDIYDQLKNPEGSIVRRIQNFLQKVVGLAPVVILGRGVFQYSFGIVPFRHPIYTIVGAPIEVPRTQYPSKEQIVELHGKYVEAVKELYNKYKHKYAADPSVELQIV